MIFSQLERLLTEHGFYKVPSNLPEFSFFFRRENTYVNVLHTVDYKQGIYISEEQYVHIKEKIYSFFQEKGIQEVHILSLLISPDIEKARQLCGKDAFCWLIDPVENRLMVHENQIADFYGLRGVLEDFLYKITITTAPTEEAAAQQATQGARSAPGVKTVLSSWVTLVLVVMNTVLFIICTFSKELLYNAGTFSVRNLIENGEWYRILTSMFLHGDIGHLVSNMLVLYYIGNVVEKQLGHLPYMITYFLSGFAGNIFSAAFELLTGQYISTLGASGAVFGIEGALLILALLHKGKLAGITAGRIVFALAFALYCGFTSSYINNAAHVGGMLTGFLSAAVFWLLVPAVRREQRKA